MNSFKLTAVGRLARNPEWVETGDVTFARFCLVGYDAVSASEPGGPREAATSLWFLAFGEIASMIARNSRKGDQLILEARIVANHWTDKQRNKQHGHTFIVTGFIFGTQHGGNSSSVAGRRTPPGRPPAEAAEAEMEVST